MISIPNIYRFQLPPPLYYQQKSTGEALLRRFPEVDLVLGPQYIPWLSDLLVEVGKGSQLCMTESMLWSESGGSATNAGKGWNSSREKDGDWMVPIKRGHSVRGWVNVIYGCNE